MGPVRRYWPLRPEAIPRVEIPLALVVDGSPDVVAVTRDVARSLCTLVRVCRVEEAGLLARRWRAYAVVVPWTASDTDAALFELLTRSSGSQVIALSTIVPSHDALRSAMQAALAIAGR
jgi:hypothetical protein